VPLSTPTVLASSSSIVSGQTRTTASIVPTQGALLVVGMVGAGASNFTFTSVTSTISGLGGWVYAQSATDTVSTTNIRAMLGYCYVVGAPSSGTISVVTSAATTRMQLFVAQITGADQFSPVTLTGSATAANAVNLPLGGTQAATSTAFGIIGAYGPTAWAPAGGATELVEVAAGSTTRAQLQYLSGAASSLTWTPTGAASPAASVGFSVVAAANVFVAATEVEVSYAPTTATVHSASASFSQTATCSAAATILTTVATQVAAVEVEVFYLVGGVLAVTASFSQTTTLAADATVVGSYAVSVAAVEVDIIYRAVLDATASLTVTSTLGASATISTPGTLDASAAIGPNRVGLSTSDGQELRTDTGSPVEVTGFSPFTLSATAVFGGAQISASLTATPTCNATARMVNSATATASAVAIGNAAAVQRWAVTASMSASATGVADALLLPATGTLYPATASLSTTATMSAAATQIVAVTHAVTASFSQTATCSAAATIIPGTVHDATASFSQTATCAAAAVILLSGTVLDAAGSFTVTSTLAADATLETDIPEPLQASASLVAYTTGSAAAEAVYLGPTIYYASAGIAPVAVLTSPTATMTMQATAGVVTVPMLYASAVGVEPPGATYAVVTITAATAGLVLSAANAGIKNTPTNARS